MLRALLLTAGVGGLVAAAPVPKAPPAPAPQTPANLTLGTAALDNNGRMRITYTAPAIPLAAVPPDSGVGPRPARQLTTSVSLDAVKVTTADGKELTGDDLSKRLGESSAVARSVTAIDPEWKKFFADDVLFVEPNGKAAVGGGVGGGVVRPLPIRPALPRVPVEEPPVEKKEEKKEEKK